MKAFEKSKRGFQSKSMPKTVLKSEPTITRQKRDKKSNNGAIIDYANNNCTEPNTPRVPDDSPDARGPSSISTESVLPTPCRGTSEIVS